MIGIYVVFLPAAWVARIVAAACWVRDRSWTPVAARAAAISGGTRWVIAGVASAMAAVVLLALPFDEMIGVAVLVFVLAMIAYGKVTGGSDAVRIAVAQLLACVLMLGFHTSTDQAFDYYKYMAGTARRLDDPDTAKDAYRRLTEISPDYGLAYYHLGRYAQKDGEVDRALELYHQAEERDPPDPRPFHAEAEIVRQRGDTDGALAILRKCHERAPAKGECALLEARLLQAARRVDEAAEAARRALAVTPAQSNSARQAQLIVNWAREQQKKAPAP
jgi:hypothetical protein